MQNVCFIYTKLAIESLWLNLVFNLQSCNYIFVFFADNSYLKNLCFASESNLLMKSWKTCSPDALWGLHIR